MDKLKFASGRWKSVGGTQFTFNKVQLSSTECNFTGLDKFDIRSFNLLRG